MNKGNPFSEFVAMDIQGWRAGRSAVSARMLSERYIKKGSAPEAMGMWLHRNGKIVNTLDVTTVDSNESTALSTPKASKNALRANKDLDYEYKPNNTI